MNNPSQSQPPLSGGVLHTPAFEVIVGNLGRVWSGSNFMQAEHRFLHWIKDSKTNLGRAGGESVTLMHKGEPRREYVGSLDKAQGGGA